MLTSAARAALLTLAALLATAPAATAKPAPPSLPTTSYIACNANAAGSHGGDGSRAHPWRSLAAAAGLRLQPGSRLLLRRGSRCAGTLALSGSGAPGNRALVSAYGRGRKPQIVGSGEQALLARDVSHLIVERLDIVNAGPGPGPRRGVTVVAEAGPVRDVTIRRLHVHDIGGDLSKGAHGSGGIQAAVWGEPASPPQRFAGLLIAQNRIEDVSRSGIRVDGTVDSSRPQADQPWPEASTGVVIRRNRLNRLAGDGIVPTGTVGARVLNNAVANGNLAGRAIGDPRGYVCNAGIWTFHANRTLIARNEVSGMRFNGCDGTGFDVDYDQDGTVVQFNYSHDNEGGFILLCTDDDRRRADVRFNLSIDDGATIDESPCRIAEGRIGTLDGVRFFNNTIVAEQPRLVSQFMPLPTLVNAADFQFRNNIVVATSPQPLPLPCGQRCSNNLFSNLPSAGTRPISADPRFRDPSRRGAGRLEVGRGFQLRPGSPAIGAGAPITAGPRRDYFGTPLRPAQKPTIGFAQDRP